MYDYIVVGAGSAGCVVASRLSEDPQTSVLLLEAGAPDKQQEIHIPVAFAKLFKTPVDWAYETEPQPHLNNRKLFWPRGKMLGGTSSINAMIYIRGHHRDFDRWAELGNEGWSFEDVLPYFKKGQNQERGADTYHATGGPLNVADLRDPHPLTAVFLEACQQTGIARNPDFNGAAQLGAGYFQVTQKNGKRHSTAAAYLKPALKRPNLTVQTEAHVTHLTLDGKRVTGVSYRQNGSDQTASANKEVILSGGAINSPQLLMLSGIGPASHLQDLGIPVVADLPGVGQNLQDHVASFLTYVCTQPITLANAESLGNLLKFLLFKKGPLTSNVGEAGAFVKSSPDVPLPDIQFHFAPAYFLEHGFHQPEGHGFTLGPVLVHPQSRGQITLRSSDPFEHPVIQPNYLESEADMAAMVAGVNLGRKIAQSAAFAPYRGDEYTPGEKVRGDEAVREFLRAGVETLYHPTSTCKMGRDPLAVVDENLKVHGMAGLRVADASIMPEVIGGNTNAPTIMIGEKAADLIKSQA